KYSTAESRHGHTISTKPGARRGIRTLSQPEYCRAVDAGSALTGLPPGWGSCPGSGMRYGWCSAGCGIAVDINPDMLKVGSKQLLPDGAAITWHPGDATQLDFSDNAFDIIFCQQGFQFFPDQPAAVLEMRRVLRPGGKAVVSVWQSSRAISMPSRLSCSQTFTTP